MCRFSPDMLNLFHIRPKEIQTHWVDPGFWTPAGDSDQPKVRYLFRQSVFPPVACFSLFQHHEWGSRGDDNGDTDTCGISVQKNVLKLAKNLVFSFKLRG